MSESPKKLLIIEDTRSIALVFQNWLKKRGFSCTVAMDGEEGFKLLQSSEYDLALIDLDLPGLSGLEILKRAQQLKLNTRFVVVTSSGSVSVAVEAMRLGASDFVIKPVAEEKLVATVRRTLNATTEQSRPTSKKRARPVSFSGFIGKSPTMKSVFRTIEAVGRSDAPVFITGESGTGKEMCAEALHASGDRASGPFVAINCAAIPGELMESEIFGHVPGAFTGATAVRAGAAATANGGTLFLDEVCEMDLALQAKLLRFLQTGLVQKVGSDRPAKVDTRIVCATNRSPAQEVKAGRFRQDLFYRLHVIPIHMPPLRERGTDILDLATTLLQRFCAEEDKAFKAFSEEAVAAINAYRWPGNVRELQNLIRKAIILNNAEILTEDMLQIGKSNGLEVFSSGNRSSDGVNGEYAFSVQLDQNFSLIERDIIEAAISHCGNSIPKASDMLGLSPSTIYRKREAWANQTEISATQLDA